MKQVQAILPHIFDVNPKLLKFALDLIRPRLARRVLLLLLTAALFGIVPLGLVTRLASRFETRGVELRHAAFCLGAHAPHVKTLGDAPARCGREVGRDSASVIFVIFVAHILHLITIAIVKRAGWG
jgi:hypothetical protein